MKDPNRQRERALKQLRQASDNLSAISANTGDEPCLKASQLVSLLHNALAYGATYKTASCAAAFDLAQARKEVIIATADWK